MKKLLPIVILLSLSGCTYLQRKIASVSNIFSIHYGSNLINEARAIQTYAKSASFNSSSCDGYLQDLNNEYSWYSAEVFKNDEIEIDGGKILNEMFQARLALHEKLSEMPSSCALKLKDLYRNMRMIEDYVSVIYYKKPQIESGSINFDTQPIPVYDAKEYNPAFYGPGVDPNQKFEFKSGDIMITKGVSFISSTISRIPEQPSVFSHIVFVHVDDKTKAVTTIESYIGKGVEKYSIEDALRNENARILVLRPKNQILTKQAAEYMYQRVVNAKTTIPYDYDLNFEDNSKLSCEEVAYDAYRTESQGKFIIPEHPSNIILSDTQFLRDIGLRLGALMTPADMETDSRFDIVLDWTDVRLIRDSWRKDASLTAMFRWINNNNYKVRENLSSLAARLVWLTRPVPGLWNIMSWISGIPKNFTEDVPNHAIAAMAKLKKIGSIILPVAKAADENYYRKSGRWMSEVQLQTALENYREQDLQKYIENSPGANLHYYFSPDGIKRDDFSN